MVSPREAPSDRAGIRRGQRPATPAERPAHKCPPLGSRGPPAAERRGCHGSAGRTLGGLRRQLAEPSTDRPAARVAHAGRVDDDAPRLRVVVGVVQGNVGAAQHLGPGVPRAGGSGAGCQPGEQARPHGHRRLLDRVGRSVRTPQHGHQPRKPTHRQAISIRPGVVAGLVPVLRVPPCRAGVLVAEAMVEPLGGSVVGHGQQAHCGRSASTNAAWTRCLTGRCLPHLDGGYPPPDPCPSPPSACNATWLMPRSPASSRRARSRSCGPLPATTICSPATTRVGFRPAEPALAGRLGLYRLTGARPQNLAIK